LLDFTSGRYSKFELSLDFLRDSCELILIKSDISPVDRLQNHVASVRCRLGWITVQFEHVGVRREFNNSIIILSLETALRFLLSGFAEGLLLYSRIIQSDTLRSSEEGVRNFNLKQFAGHFCGALWWYFLAFISVTTGGLVTTSLFLSFLLLFLSHLLLGLDKSVVLKVQGLLETEWLFRITVTSESIEDFG
jgi:hypothetical protein